MMQFGENRCVFAIKRNVPNVIPRMHHMEIYRSDRSQISLCLFLFFFLHYVQSFVCILAARSAMQFGENRCVFVIKRNVPNTIPRMCHIRIYRSDLSQLALCLFCFYLSMRMPLPMPMTYTCPCPCHIYVHAHAHDIPMSMLMSYL